MGNRCRQSCLIYLPLIITFLVFVYYHWDQNKHASKRDSHTAGKYRSLLKNTGNIKKNERLKLDDFDGREQIERHEQGKDINYDVNGDNSSIGTKILTMFKYYIGQAKDMLMKKEEDQLSKSEVKTEVERFRKRNSLKEANE